MKNPTEVKALERGRIGYWDDASGTIVVEDPGDMDGGTAYRPSDGKVRFDELK